MESEQPFSRYVKFSPHLYWHIVVPLMLLTLLGLFVYVSYAYPAAGDLVRNSTILATIGRAANAVVAPANAAAKTTPNSKSK
jgi:hypothetical protein